MELLGMLWWVDRWRKSAAYTSMNLPSQAAYRNLLDECWLRGGKLPNDDHVLARACGDARQWSKIRATVMRWFYLGSDGCFHNKTLDEVLLAARARVRTVERTRERSRERMRNKRHKSAWDQDQDQ